MFTNDSNFNISGSGNSNFSTSGKGLTLGNSNDNTPSRIYKIKLYYTDSPTPIVFDDVWHIQTEGQLLRLIVNGKSQWIPLNNVAYFKEIDKEDRD